MSKASMTAGVVGKFGQSTFTSVSGLGGRLDLNQKFGKV